MSIKTRLNSKSLTSISLKLWGVCILTFIGFLSAGVWAEWKDKVGSIAGIGLLATFIFGVLFFLIAIIASILTRFNKKYQSISVKPRIIRFLAFSLYFLLYPIAVIADELNPLPFISNLRSLGMRRVVTFHNFVVWAKLNLRNKIATLAAFFFVILPLWSGGYAVLYFGERLVTGNLELPTDVEGRSMLPTLQDGERPSLLPKIPFSELSSGSIVVFSNGATFTDGQTSSFIKRVVALPGDSIEIRNGYLFKNGTLFEEPYTLKQRSTFGNKFLEECKQVTVPEGYYFVMGDNRTRSQDSRELGFVSFNDISSYLPLDRQDEYKERWRDTSHDKDTSTLASISNDDYYTRLNEERKNNNLKEIKRDEKLELAARKVAENLVKNNELNIEFEKRSYSTDRAISEARATSNSWQEIDATGYYDGEDLLGHWLEFENTKKIIHSDKYTSVGIGSYLDKVDGCEVQVIVQIMGSYVPPNYPKSDIEGWENNLSKLREILPSWENIRNSSNVYSNNKEKSERIIELIKTRISRIDRIVTRMRANQWLTSEEQGYINQDQTLYNEQESLATFLNNQKW